MSWEATTKALSVAWCTSEGLPSGVESWAFGCAMFVMELWPAALSLFTDEQTGACSNKVLAVARAAPSKHRQQ